MSRRKTNLETLEQVESNIEQQQNNDTPVIEKETKSPTPRKYYDSDEEENISSEKETVENSIESQEVLDIPKYQTIDGYRLLDRDSLPYGGMLYPESWHFTFRCPTVAEVAEFSVIDERDTPKIQEAVTNLLKKCYVIVDTETDSSIPASQINDGDRLFFFLKLREFYMQDLPIEYPVISMIHQEQLSVNLMAHHLIFKGEITEKMMEWYDGRKWTIPVEKFGIAEPIEFLNPTIDISNRIFKYLTNKYREANDNNKNKKELNKKEFDKKFIQLLPYLYVEGNEKIESLYHKYKTQILKNENLYKAYLAIATNFVHTNEEYIIINYNGDEEKTEIRFPGGWKNMFIADTGIDQIFG